MQEMGGRRWFSNLLPAAAESGAARGVVHLVIAHVVQRHATHLRGHRLPHQVRLALTSTKVRLAGWACTAGQAGRAAMRVRAG